MRYLVNIPTIVSRWIYPDYLWRMPAEGKKVYLTFDDGPHPTITPFVLDQLARYQAKASFFCIGKNVKENPGVYARLLSEGHGIGNHTYNHLHALKTEYAEYFKNIHEASKWIDSKMFRPPYGRITRFQAKQIREKLGYKIIMWSVLSGDFDLELSGEKCYHNVIKHTKPGAVIVFHDSEKAYDRLRYSLPLVLETLTNKGFVFDKLPF